MKNSRVGLVEAGERHGFELEAVLEDVLGDRGLHLLDEVDALLVQFLHRHLGGDGAQGVDELAFDQLLERRRLHGAAAQRLGGVGDRLRGRLNADVELGLHVDAHAVLGDQRLLGGAPHLEAQRVHVDLDDLVQHRQHQRAAVHDHLLAAEKPVRTNDTSLLAR